jgi:hypothetical protein
MTLEADIYQLLAVVVVVLVAARLHMFLVLDRFVADPFY